MTRPLIVAAALLGVIPAAQAQEKSEPRPLVPVKLQIVFEKYQGDKRISSEPYTMSLNANEKASGNFDRVGKIRMGIDVPMRMDRAGDKEVPGNVVYRSVGNSADCTVTSVDDARFKINCAFEQSSVSPSRPGASLAMLTPPMLQTFRSETGVILKDNQTSQYVAGTDPVSGDVLKVGLTLSVTKQ